MAEEILVDANIFLEIFLNDSKSDKCKEFLESLQEQNKQAVITDFLLYSCILVVQNSTKGAKAVKDVIIFFNSYAPLNILRPSFKDIYDAVGIMENSKLDFDDSLVVACMRNYGIEKLASMDKHFDKVKDIKRLSF